MCIYKKVMYIPTGTFFLIVDPLFSEKIFQHKICIREWWYNKGWHIYYIHNDTTTLNAEKYVQWKCWMLFLYFYFQLKDFQKIWILKWLTPYWKVVYVHLIPIFVTNSIREGIIVGSCQFDRTELSEGNILCKTRTLTKIIIMKVLNILDNFK
jgi:hypothetical protein